MSDRRFTFQTFICLSEGMIMKKPKKFMKFIIKSFIVLAAISIVTTLVFIGINIYVKQYSKSKIITFEDAKNLQDVDCIIVLGASVRNGDTPSLMLADRLNKGIELYYAGCSPKLLMSGDHGGMYYDEVNVMKNFAIAKGVPSYDIFMDHAGFSTYESMYRAKEIFGAKKVLIVTQEYHLTRALYIANELGLDAYGVATDKVTYGGQMKRDVREFLAVGKDFFKTIFKPNPAMMGSPVSLSGSGDVTNDRD